ncbi:hypothetical protein [Amorphus sp. 3PC139-8]|uniref:hypothetical protein n=1 Tax=Amorphus sp. 3PC139-8 TaxID=2735676 RepID=UPI00345DD543
MARKAKAKQAESGAIDATTLQKAVAEYNQEKATASEHQGLAGQAIKQVAEEYHLDMKAFRFVLGLSRMEETKRQAVLRGLIDLADKMEFFASVDAFDDLVSIMETICERARSAETSEAAPKPDDVVSHLIN